MKNWALFSIQGQDAERFLNGQLTNDVLKLVSGNGQFSARVNRTGHLLYYGHLIKKDSKTFYFLCPKDFCKDLAEDLNKFIIMDEVEIDGSKLDYGLSLGLSSISTSPFKFLFLGKVAGLDLDKKTSDVSEAEVSTLENLFGIPKHDRFLKKDKLISGLSIVDTAVDLEKGCFVGQETIKKIELNRGAGLKDVLIKVKSSELDQLKVITINKKEYEVLTAFQLEEYSYYSISAPREIRIQDMVVRACLEKEELEGMVKLLPLKKYKDDEVAQEIYEEGVRLFTIDKEEDAQNSLIIANCLDPENVEIIESLGALEGRLGSYQRAIDLMNELEKKSPNSVMAHTNKSLYYMKLGNIEKAEEEKAKATLKGLNVSSGQEDNNEKRERQLKRLDMYKQVLEIDPDDLMANEGVGQIYFELGDFIRSEEGLLKVLALDHENTKAMSTIAKIFLLKNKIDEAKELILKAIHVAGKKGDFVLGNELQSLLNSLETQS